RSKRSAIGPTLPKGRQPSNPTEKVMTPDYPKPPFASQRQPMPGTTGAMQPRPDHGEKTYKGCGRLKGLKAVITGGDSGIGRAVAIAYAREGADILIAYLNEHEDANEVKQLVEQEGRNAVLVPGDLKDPQHCREAIKRAIDDLGGVDILVNNAAHQATFKDIRDNAVAPGPIWTPLIPSTMPEDALKNFGKQVPMNRPGQPVELATTYVMLADPMSSYVSGATVPVTGGKPFI